MNKLFAVLIGSLFIGAVVHFSGINLALAIIGGWTLANGITE